MSKITTAAKAVFDAPLTSRLPHVTLLLLALLICGCDEPNVGLISGSVQVDGKPAKTGAITFIPVDGKSGTAGAVIEAGKYNAIDVPIGSHKVEIRVSKVVGQKKLYDTPDSPVKPLMQEVLPAKFNTKTELLLDVKPGKNEKDYDLSSK